MNQCAVTPIRHKEDGCQDRGRCVKCSAVILSARRDLARAHYGLLMAKLRLEAEADELDEDDLTTVNTILQ